ncbi:MAG: hypothetical protein COT71_02335 [Candidatus Andersenbacteria bacterium CG10_big_fil_rev_8_21_14_0_10_54_11]|uniref:Ribbon-helix-helix protein CopG domain-containing protein n=1 Tax=Candidatus Andersenbacteria bacterium CG10_big_fil_rev_8_21_14_0_10_54_11 TaxID=1974485 RepID=A0A2M6WZD5_9BACT|nr:MAG: hypothetical protein COT71_02335 [Candidatus Andersenbacteria bacterium CG10_big_fil_rev_8_21_14_0_10_54_11]
MQSTVLVPSTHMCIYVYMKQKLVPITVYIQPEIKRAVRQAAKRRRCTDAEVIREALAAGLERLEDRQAAAIFSFD